MNEKILRAASARRRKLRCMQQPAQSEPSPASANFAAMLAALASPPAEVSEPAGAWSESDLGDDVVTLSYERALCAHGRYKPTERSDWQPKPPPQVDERLTPQGNRESLDAFDGDLRTASVTVRLSKGECARLHERAAEAGLTVSAYMRSCTVEAEALRAQVKAALTGMRPPGAKDQLATPAREGPSVFVWATFQWLARLFAHRRSSGGPR